MLTCLPLFSLTKKELTLKQLFIDTETTGLDPQKHEIWQVSCLLEIDGVEKGRFNSLMQPSGEIDPSVPNFDTALNPQAIEKYPLSRAAYDKFTQFLNKYVNRFDKNDKLFFLAYNSPFDAKFTNAWSLKTDWVRAWCEKNDSFRYAYGCYFWWPDICIMRLACEKLAGEREKLQDFKLGTVASYLGVEFDEVEAHDALYDIEKTREVYKKLKELK